MMAWLLDLVEEHFLYSKIPLLFPRLCTCQSTTRMTFSQMYTYAHVPESEPTANIPTRRLSSSFTGYQAVLLIFTAIMSSAVTLGFAQIFNKPLVIKVNAATTNHTLPRLTCGNSSTEAPDKGCTFDPLTFSRIHPSWPRDMVEEHLSYQKGRPWEYWFDKEGTQLLP